MNRAVSPTTRRPTRTARSAQRDTSFHDSTPEADTELSALVDLDRGAGAAGFIGKMSAIAWTTRARAYLFQRSTSRADMPQKELEEHDYATQDLNYFIDDTNLLLVDEDDVNPLEWPHPDIALTLSKAYFDTLHTCFPFIDKMNFLNTLTHFREGRTSVSWNERRWMSMANLIFAVGSKHLNMGSRDAVPDHLIYYARARALGLDHRLLFDHPRFEQIQALGILGLYLFVNHSVARFVPLAVP